MFSLLVADSTGRSLATTNEDDDEAVGPRAAGPLSVKMLKLLLDTGAGATDRPPRLAMGARTTRAAPDLVALTSPRALLSRVPLSASFSPPASLAVRAAAAWPDSSIAAAARALNCFCISLSSSEAVASVM